ncbi:MAG: AraC family transcriptional regulator ligand-binding domain-containing protein [Halioglobus sp.]|nr:AraC family transcriptional regulator ligand-binding domain-containing protein [Halioglobus sp.]
MSLDSGGSVTAPCLNAVLQAASALGVDSAQLLRDAGINKDLLRAPGERIPLARYLYAYRMAVERSGDPDIGLCVGHVVYFSAMNLHLYMTTICRNLKEYFNVIPSTIRIRGDTGRVLIRSQGDFIRLEWHPLNAETAAWRPLVDEMLKSSAEIVNTICALPVPVRGADFAYPAPDDTRALTRAFGTNLKFGCEVSCLYFAREVVRYPLIDVGFDPGGDFWAGARSVFEQPDSVEPFLQDTRVAIRRALPGGGLTIDSLAQELGISRRTLQRRLSALGSSFKKILQDVREEQSRRYLDDPRLAVTEIALLLGYSDQASFSNAFKAWCGCAPTEYRHRAPGWSCGEGILE